MRKYKHILVCSLLLFSILLVSCKSNDIKASNNDEGTVEIPSAVLVERRVVELNLDNFRDYFDFIEGTMITSPCYTFRGCLDYAYYYNCVVTINHDGTIEQYKLNTAGNSDLPTHYRNTELVSITGKVIFWM